MAEGFKVMKNSKGLYTAKHIAVIAMTVALLIGGQFALSFEAGVEVVSLILCVFCVTFGIRDGVVAAVAFSFLRCFVFGFYPTVIVLYMIYYPIFAFVLALYGKYLNSVFYGKRGTACNSVKENNAGKSSCDGVLSDGDLNENNSDKKSKSSPNRKGNGKKVFAVVVLVIICAALTASFTMIDNVITPLMLGFGENSARAYFFSSLPTLATHCTCVTISLAALFYPTYKSVYSLKRKMFGE